MSDSDVVRGISPVRLLPGEQADSDVGGTGLCLSGGGFRAMLFHLGSLRRLNDAGILGGLARISSVSGGSIVAAALGLRWHRLGWQDGIAAHFDAELVEPIRELARHTIDVSSVAEGLFSFGSVGERLADAYRDHLFEGASLQDLPAEPAPLFVICATNLESGALFRFTRHHAADWRVGLIPSPDIDVADAVAASSAFPPVLSPFDIDLRDAVWETVRGNDLTGSEYRERVSLTDGGVYDNLGLETVWKRCRTVLVSDAGGRMTGQADPPHDWPRHMVRVLKVIDNQVRDLRKRQVVASFKLNVRAGTYWGIRSDVSRYGLRDPLPCPVEDTEKLAAIPTRLRALDDDVQKRLINWGYASCDTAIRRWLNTDLPRPPGFPYEEVGVSAG